MFDPQRRRVRARQLGEALGAAFALPVNTVSVPIRQIDGVYVLRVDAKKPADKRRVRGAEEGAPRAATAAAQAAAPAGVLADLRKSAKIDDRRKEIDARARADSR